MRRARQALTGLVACVALIWAAAAMAASDGKPGRLDNGGGLPGAFEEQLEICQDNLGASLDLGKCSSDLGTCSGDLGTCSSDLGTCADNLAACEAGAEACQPPGDGITGTPLAYEDCGDGTVVDLNTGLMWEQKVEGGDDTTCLTELHGVGSECDWVEARLDWIDAVNAESYAGYTDWRLPHIKELQSIVDYSVSGPAIQSVFGATAWSDYWSATAVANAPDLAWVVGFDLGNLFFNDKTFDDHVRAVRSGSCP